MCDAPPALVVDNGSSLTRAGLAGESAPKAVFPSVAGRLRHPDILPGLELKEVYVGSEALKKRGILVLRHPVERGIITNWEDMEQASY